MSGVLPPPRSQVLETASGRILCIADIRGRLAALNDLAKAANAVAIIHTGDFGFLDAESLHKMDENALRQLAFYSPLVPTSQEAARVGASDSIGISMLSEFPRLLAGEIRLEVPVYTVWGASEDVDILEAFRTGEYAVPNLYILSEESTHLVCLGGLRLRLLGLGGAFSLTKLFDNGGHESPIAGAGCSTWTTALQIGRLVETAERVFSPSETRLLVTFASPGREGSLSQLALALQADFTLSAGLHFRATSSYNDYSVQRDFSHSGLRHKVLLSKKAFLRLWEEVKPVLEGTVGDLEQRELLNRAVRVLNRVPGTEDEEVAWRTCWHWNLCDVKSGTLVLDVRDCRIGSEIRSEGFSFAHRGAERRKGEPAPRQPMAALDLQMLDIDRNRTAMEDEPELLPHRKLKP
ncbi:DUF2433 domain-containing protein [Mycena chlorophos]|uniref:DUF2433 domain-containing protein n=1 Tax=Mycena chlorophos TaxID=658473 RepID=A0A8H6RZW5_MYCCL|nr:DUF2433 domain-containing protein [Mycena chlorophos]